MTQAVKKDLVIIGAGPGGYPAAFHAAEMGMSVALIDPEPYPGGVCLYRGCVPSKTLLHVAAFLHEVEQAAAWGVCVGKPEVDLEKLRVWKQSVVERLTKGLGQHVRQRGIEYIQGKATLTNPHRVRVATADETETFIDCDHAIVATGSVSATIPGIPDSDRIMTSRQALDLRDLPSRLLIIGGGYIGLELGQVYAALGSKVTLVEMTPELLPGADRELVRFLARRLDRQFETIQTGTKVVRMQDSEEGLQVTFAGKLEGDDCFDRVMLAVGRKPFTDGVGLETTRASLTGKGFIEVDGQRRTAEASIFAIGDVAGEPMLAHKATYEARVVVEAIAGKKTVFDPKAIPCVVFSDPEIAWCGLSEADAAHQGRKLSVTTFPWAASGRAATVGRQDGVTKLLFDPESGRLLGAGIAGRGAGELLAEAVLAMEMGAVADDLAWTIHTHPTLSETMMEAAQAFSGTSTHIKREMATA